MKPRRFFWIHAGMIINSFFVLASGVAGTEPPTMRMTPQTFLSLLGSFPEKPPLEVRVLEQKEYGTYTRRLIEYSTEKEERVQAFLLLPRKRIGLLPGILAIHQDGEHRPYEYGKSEPAGVAGDSELQYGLELCQRGYVVICPDRFPFESRRLANSKFKETFAGFPIFTRYQGKELDLTEDLYQSCVANRLLWEGRTLLGKTLFELMRAIDCLSQQPEVDPKRIGVIGHSAGGLLACMTMYVDPRIKAGGASTGTFLIQWIYGKDSLKPINGFAGNLAVPSLGGIGDIDDMLAGLAPRPFFESVGDQGMAAQWEAKVQKARLRYAAHGISDRFEQIIYPGGHAFPKEMRQKTYDWLDRWLRPNNSAAQP